jgi:hypothetical protein
LEDKEKKELEKIAKEYNLSQDTLLAINKKATSEVFQNIISDKKITEEEKKELNTLLEYF